MLFFTLPRPPRVKTMNMLTPQKVLVTSGFSLSGHRENDRGSVTVTEDAVLTTVARDNLCKHLNAKLL